MSVGRSRRHRLIPFLSLAALVTAANCGGASAAKHPRTAPASILEPRLILSSKSGRAGDVIRVRGVQCLPLSHQPDALSWHDSYQLAHPLVRPAFRRVEPLHRSGNTVRARFRILRRDHPGRGLLDLLCGGQHGNALAWVVVTR